MKTNLIAKVSLAALLLGSQMVAVSSSSADVTKSSKQRSWETLPG